MDIQSSFLKVCPSFEYAFDIVVGIIKRDKLRALAGGDPNALKLYIVATLFRNFHVWLYGCQTSNYFNITYSNPEELLAKYINNEDI